MNTQLKDDKNIWLVTADMGYGHQRAVYPLKQLSSDQILTIGMDFRTPWYEKMFWLLNLKSYEFLSRVKNLPFIGEKLFKMLDFLLAIPPVYPNKNHSGKSFQVIILEKFIQSGLCKSVISMIDSQKRPLVTSFYAIAMAAEYHKTENIYCIIDDVIKHTFVQHQIPGKLKRIRSKVIKLIKYNLVIRKISLLISKKNAIKLRLHSIYSLYKINRRF